MLKKVVIARPRVLQCYSSILVSQSRQFNIWNKFLNNESKHYPKHESDDHKIMDTVKEAYQRNHIPLSHVGIKKYGELPYTDTKLLENIQMDRHEKPVDWVDKMALKTMKFLRIFTHLFFRDKYLHHAVVLETVAAVPGMLAGMIRHFNSLRTMTRDHGKIGKLLEEAENERMHLLVWMQVCQPTVMERLLVIAAQFGYATFYTAVYVLHPRLAHRLVGYLEEEAFEQYTLLLRAIDNKWIPNMEAPEIAKKYWNLAPDATLRDVCLVVRSDEAAHRDYNHELANKIKMGIH